MSKMRTVILVAVSVFAITSASGIGPSRSIDIVEAQGGPFYGGVLRVAATGNPNTCDLPTSQGNQSQSVVACAPMLNQLVKYRPTDPQIIWPDAVQSWSISADASTFAFVLAPGIKWHDGTTLTATDVKFSLDRILTPPTGIAIGSPKILQSYIQQVQVLDASTLQITTNFPAPSLVANLASVHVPIYPQAAVEALDPLQCRVRARW